MSHISGMNSAMTKVRKAQGEGLYGVGRGYRKQEIISGEMSLVWIS